MAYKLQQLELSVYLQVLTLQKKNNKTTQTSKYGKQINNMTLQLMFDCQVPSVPKRTTLPDLTNQNLNITPCRIRFDWAWRYLPGELPGTSQMKCFPWVNLLHGGHSWKQQQLFKHKPLDDNKKQLKNVGPICHCEPPHALILNCHSPRHYCRTPPAHRCPWRRRRRRQRQRVTEGTTMAPWNGPNDDEESQRMRNLISSY